MGDLDVDCATGSFCSSCAIPPRVVGGLWSDGVGCDVCCYDCASVGVIEIGLDGLVKSRSAVLISEIKKKNHLTS